MQPLQHHVGHVGNCVSWIEANKFGSRYPSIQDEGDDFGLLREPLLKLSSSWQSKNQLAAQKDRQIHLPLARSDGHVPICDAEALGDGANTVTKRRRNCRSSRHVTLLAWSVAASGQAMGTTAACSRPYRPSAARTVRPPPVLMAPANLIQSKPRERTAAVCG